MKNKALNIIAGPCSIDEKNIDQVQEIIEMTVSGKYIVSGTRIVGLKSRTGFDSTGNGMGIDFEIIQRNQEILLKGGTINDMIPTPSIKLTKEILKHRNMIIATEIMQPMLQIPVLKRELSDTHLIPWNPSVNQLGWQIQEMAKMANDTNWSIGIKNGKWIGSKIEADLTDSTIVSPLEKTWSGLVSYADNNSNEVILIHRGVDIPEKGDYRNFPIHNIAGKVKKNTGAKLFFDPSHVHGPRMRDDIVTATIDAMNRKIQPDEYLYDGILIEVGDSKTDTDQHITIGELKELATILMQTRELVQVEQEELVYMQKS